MTNCERTLNLQYSYNDCFDAMLQTIKALGNFSIKEHSKAAGIIVAYYSGKFFSNNDFIDISVNQESVTLTAVTISNKIGLPPYWLPKRDCRKNVEEITGAFLNYLQNNYVTAQLQDVDSSQSTIESRLLKLKSLLDNHIISQDEYEKQRAAIIADI